MEKVRRILPFPNSQPFKDIRSNGIRSKRHWFFTRFFCDFKQSPFGLLLLESTKIGRTTIGGRFVGVTFEVVIVIVVLAARDNAG
jgi:hypothetical protein